MEEVNPFPSPRNPTKRVEAIYEEDMSMSLRNARKSAEVIGLYKEFWRPTYGHMSHKLLHTGYMKGKGINSLLSN